MHYFKLQKFEFKQLIDDMTINLWLPLKFASIENIWRQYNLTVGLLKFVSNFKILSGYNIAKSYTGCNLNPTLYIYIYIYL